MKNANAIPCRALVVGCLTLSLMGIGSLGAGSRTAFADDDLQYEEGSDGLILVEENEGNAIEIVTDDTNAGEHIKNDIGEASRVSPWQGVDYRETVDPSSNAQVYPSNGKWVDLEDGTKGFRQNDELLCGWASIAGVKYYFDESGRMLTGWQSLQTEQGIFEELYLRPSGSVATGWCEIDGQMHYFSRDGAMVTGWLTITDGATREERHYFCDANGVILTGWQEIDGRQLYFRESGSLAIGWADVEGIGKCYFDQYGMLVTGWQQIAGQTYYFRESGTMQTGTATIDGVEYEFSDKGVLLLEEAISV